MTFIVFAILWMICKIYNFDYTTIYVFYFLLFVMEEVTPMPTPSVQTQTVVSTPDLWPQTVDYNPPFRKKISRLFIFRPLWVFIMIWPLYVWGIWIAIIWFLHFWYKLILWKRHEGFWKRQVRFMRHIVKWYSYFGGIIDKRPAFIED